ncbi:MAG: hypothetical protein IJ146_03410 [Kiritimatiellae bacterium]|nr:hypothetical protein [Kiritimatiellia bacterium]
MGSFLLHLVWPCLAAICLFGLVCFAWRRRLRNAAVAALAAVQSPMTAGPDDALVLDPGADSTTLFDFLLFGRLPAFAGPSGLPRLSGMAAGWFSWKCL